MEISGINSTFPFLFRGNEKNSIENGQLDTGDVVNISAPQILTDEEAEQVYNETLNLIAQDGAAALSVHSGLTESRVFALLGL